MSDSESELVELFSSGDGESEDKDNEKEKDDKFPIYLYTAKLNIQKKIINILHSDDVRSMHYPETTTPPPKV